MITVRVSLTLTLTRTLTLALALALTLTLTLSLSLALARREISLVLSVRRIQRAWRARCAHLAENLFRRNGISDPATIERLNRLRAELCLLGRDEVRHARRTPATTAPPPPLHHRRRRTATAAAAPAA